MILQLLISVLRRNSQALRYAIRNTSLPARVRVQAQLELAQTHPHTRPTQIKNRCIESGTARSVFRDFRLNRVSRIVRPDLGTSP